MPVGSSGDTRPGWAPPVAPLSDSSDLPIAVPLPDLLKEQWRPLDLLGKCLCPGAVLWRERDGRYVLQAKGTCMASAPSLEDLARKLASVRPGDKTGLRVKLRVTLLCDVRSVINQRESLSAFIRTALRHEILRRRAEDAQEEAAWEDQP